MMAERPEGSVVENHRHHAHLGKRQVVTAVTSLTAAAVLQCLTGVGLFFISSGDDDDPETQLAAWRLTALMLMGQGLSSFLLALPLLTYSRRHNPLQSSTLLCSRIAAVCTGLTGLFLAVGGLYLLEIQEKEAGKSPWKLWTCLAGAGVFLLFLSCTSLMASYWPTLSSSRQSDHRSHERREDQRPLLLESTEDEVETGSYRLLEDGQQQTTEGAENGGGSRPQEETHSHSRLTGTRRLLQLAAPEVLYLWTGCIVLLIRLPFSLAIPHFVSTTLSAVAHAQFARAKQEIFRLFLLGTVDALLDFWCVFLFGYANQRIVRGLRVDLFAKLLQQEVAFFDVTSSGELASRLNSDCSEMAGDLTWFFRFSIESIVRITGITTYMLIRSPLLGACALSIVPAVGAINKVYGDWLRRNAVQVQDALAEANATAQESLSNVRTIMAFAAEQQQCERYERKIERQYQLNIRQLYATGVYYMAVSTFLINTVVQGTLLLIGTIMIQHGKLTGEVLLAFMLYQGQLQNETQNLFNSYTSLIKSSGAGDKVFALLDRRPRPPSVGDSRSVSDESPPEESEEQEQRSHNYDVQLKGVTFQYPSRPEATVLDALDLNIPKGKTVALVGESGCGKSTIINLLQRFYDPSAGGGVLIDGVNLKLLDLLSHRRHIGVVTQDPVLFCGTLRENIAFGCPLPTPGEATTDDNEGDIVERAARLANADSFIRQFPDGYETEIGERGVQLSGGQKQRIAIARAVIRNPSLLLLDEATSALDAESEEVVQEALDRLLKQNREMTTVIVAHRLRTVRNADKIAVLHGGRVVEEGTHEQLMKMAGVYHKMVSRASSTGMLPES